MHLVFSWTKKHCAHRRKFAIKCAELEVNKKINAIKARSLRKWDKTVVYGVESTKSFFSNITFLFDHWNVSISGDKMQFRVCLYIFIVWGKCCVLQSCNISRRNKEKVASLWGMAETVQFYRDISQCTWFANLYFSFTPKCGCCDITRLCKLELLLRVNVLKWIIEKCKNGHVKKRKQILMKPLHLTVSVRFTSRWNLDDSHVEFRQLS